MDMNRNESALKQNEKWNEMMSNKIGHGNGCEIETEKRHGNEAVSMPCHETHHRKTSFQANAPAMVRRGP